MSTTEAVNPPSPSPSSARSTRTRLKAYLVRRGRQLRRFLLIVVLLILFMAGLLEAWRGASLIGLPNVGDPFDVAAYHEFRVTEQDDAMVWFSKAHQKLTHMPGGSGKRGPADAWSKVDPELRDWVTANRAALDIFRTASEKPDVTPPGVERDFAYFQFTGEFSWLVLLEASRLEEQGDMEGAWSWYRALFRMKLHVMRRGSVFQRFLADRNCSAMRLRIETWAADRRTNMPLLREALADIRAGEPKPEWDAFSLKVDYLEQMHELDTDWGRVYWGVEEAQHVKVFGEDLPPNLAWIPYASKRYFWNEPERSRRVLRLAFANWLAHAENNDPQSQKPAVRASFQDRNRNKSVYFFQVDPKAPELARKLTPQTLAKWFVSTIDAKVLQDFWPWPAIRTTERREHRALVVTLAEELYKRDHGKPPAKEADLVGTYLDHLPSDGTEELDNGTAQVISNEKSAAGVK